ncbi:MAG: hypothetical protein VW270_17280, partial [Candidatus Poseidoniales archaeon]
VWMTGITLHTGDSDDNYFVTVGSRTIPVGVTGQSNQYECPTVSPGRTIAEVFIFTDPAAGTYNFGYTVSGNGGFSNGRLAVVAMGVK